MSHPSELDKAGWECKRLWQGLEEFSRSAVKLKYGVGRTVMMTRGEIATQAPIRWLLTPTTSFDDDFDVPAAKRA
jgi:hypothetical protein